MMIDLDQFREAFQSQNPTMTLREMVVEYRNQGVEKDALVQSLEELRHEVNEQDEDVILEVLDFLTGFCSPQMRID